MIRVCATVSLAAAGEGFEGRTRKAAFENVEEVARAVCHMLGECAENSSGVMRSHEGVHLEGSVGAGEITWDLALADPEALEAIERELSERGWLGLLADRGASEVLLREISNLEAWLIEPLAKQVDEPERARIKRTNFVRVLDSAAAESVVRWGEELPLLAEFVPAIRNWCFSRVRPFATPAPRVVWTHAWEQEFETVEGLVQDYMTSPYHWGFFDAWYDPESPSRIMDPDLAHLYCPATTSVLTWARD